MKYKRKSEPVARKKNNEATVLRKYIQAAVLGRNTGVVVLSGNTEPAVLRKNTKPANFFTAVLDGITSIGLLYPTMITPIRYTEGYSTDMEMVGRDMWLAEENFRYGTQKKSAATATK